MISVRKLVSLDIYVHGAKFILIEFGLGVAALIGLGALGVIRSHGRSYLSWYLIALSVNYIVLLVYAMLLISKTIHCISPSTTDKSEMWRYTRQMFFILVPLMVPVLAMWQELRPHSPESQE